MVHLGPLPGSPRFGGHLEAVLERAVADARLLAAAGFDAIMVENFGDAPFFADDVPNVTVAAMTRAVAAVRQAVEVPVGVNVLRNDALAALAVAAAAGAEMIRVNVLAGTMNTDQGTITGRSAEVARMRSLLAPSVAVLADVFVKHAVPPPGLTLADAARDTFERGGADALIVTGSGTGSAAAAADLAAVRAAVPAATLYVGSGVTPETVRALLEVADGVIVGTAVKVGGATTAPVDPARAAALVAAAGRGGLTPGPGTPRRGR
jgi:membrane complex biogenesis BtpA family protein